MRTTSRNAYAASRMYPEAMVPIIDIWKDQHGWACFDEGCNAAVHSALWMQNFQMEIKKHGLAAPWVHREERIYTGIGKNKSVGKRRILFALHLPGIELTLP